MIVLGDAALTARSTLEAGPVEDLEVLQVVLVGERVVDITVSSRPQTPLTTDRPMDVEYEGEALEIV